VLDLEIAGGRVLDGTGAPAERADVGIAGDSITAVGDLSREPGGQTVDASGLTVAPGFIDMHMVVRDGEHTAALPGRVLGPGAG
jgi:N-acyl-D-aspartate/D-glutamate deacylase